MGHPLTSRAAAHLKQTINGRGYTLSQQTHPLLEQRLVAELTRALRKEAKTGENTWMISSTVKQLLRYDSSVFVSYRVLQLPQVDVLHRRLEGAQTVAELIFTRVAEAEVPDVAQVGHPEDKTN